jgi:hypothetical protein
MRLWIKFREGFHNLLSADILRPQNRAQRGGLQLCALPRIRVAWLGSAPTESRGLAGVAQAAAVAHPVMTIGDAPLMIAPFRRSLREHKNRTPTRADRRGRRRRPRAV